MSEQTDTTMLRALDYLKERGLPKTQEESAATIRGLGEILGDSFPRLSEVLLGNAGSIANDIATAELMDEGFQFDYMLHIRACADCKEKLIHEEFSAHAIGQREPLWQMAIWGAVDASFNQGPVYQ